MNLVHDNCRELFADQNLQSLIEEGLSNGTISGFDGQKATKSYQLTASASWELVRLKALSFILVCEGEMDIT